MLNDQACLHICWVSQQDSSSTGRTDLGPCIYNKSTLASHFQLSLARGQEGHEAEVRRLKLESQQAQSRVRALQATSRGLTGQLSERERQVQLVQRATADVRARASALAMESTFERQLSALESTTPGISRVTRWLADNPGLFRAPVHGPVGALIEVADRDRAAALEKHLPSAWGGRTQLLGVLGAGCCSHASSIPSLFLTGRLQNVFVVSTREDQDLLQQELQRRFGCDAYLGRAVRGKA